MERLETEAPEVLNELQQGIWVVNKNLKVPFCAIDVDHSLEHINRSMKVSGGLIGITLNPTARTKIFLTAPELSRYISNQLLNIVN